MLTYNTSARVSCLVLHLTCLHIPTPVVTTMSISPVCPDCGIVKKSGKISCCGRGGSWFGNCGNAENTEFGHTWYEGIESCTAREFWIAVSEQLHAFQAKGNVSSDNNSVDMHSKTAVGNMDNLIFVSSANVSILIRGPSSITVLSNSSIFPLARKSPAYDAGTTTSTTVNGKISTIAHALVNMLAPTATITANSTFTTSIIHNTLAAMSMVTSSYTSASASIHARGFENSLGVIDSMVFAVIFWHQAAASTS